MKRNGLRLFAVHVSAWSEPQLCGYVIAESGPVAIAHFRPADAPDHWRYQATPVEPVNGTLVCLPADATGARERPLFDLAAAAGGA